MAASRAVFARVTHIPQPWQRMPPARLLAAATLVAIAAVLPVFYLLVKTLDGGADAWNIIARILTADILGRTGLLIVTVTGFSVALAVPMAWLTTRTTMPFRRVLTVAAALPLVVPSYVMGMTVIDMFGPRGVLQQVLAAPFGIDSMPPVYGLPGATIVLVLISYPYVFLTVRGALLRMDPSMEEAARSMGFGPVEAMWRVTLPLLSPAIASGALLAALYALSDFGGVALMRYETFTAAIFTQYESSVDRGIAAALSLVLVVLAAALLLLDGLTRRRGHYHRSSAGAPRAHRLADLGGWRWPAAGFVALPVIVGLAAPVAILTWWLIRGLAAGEEFVPLWGPLRNSLYYSLLAALATAAAAMPVALLAVRYGNPYSRLLERSTYVGFGLPGIVIALAVVFFGVNIAQPLYQTTALLIFAYAVLFLPAAVGSLRSSILQVSPRIEEAARGLGKTGWQVMWRVTFPLVLPGALAGGALVFLMTMKELPASLILSPIGTRTLATSIWAAASEAYFARAAAPALLLIIAAGIPTAFLILRDQRFRSTG